MAGLKLFDLIPGWCYAAVIAALVAHGLIAGAQHQRTELALAEAKLDAAQAEVNRETAARLHAQEIAAIALSHATKQQESERAWNEFQKQYQARAAADARALDRLREQIRVFTTGGRPGEADPAPTLDLADRLEALGSLYAESLDLLIEGRGIIERRDGEVKRLLDQIEIDRAACQAVTTPASL